MVLDLENKIVREKLVEECKVMILTNFFFEG